MGARNGKRVKNSVGKTFFTRLTAVEVYVRVCEDIKKT